ncbi:hypothetical protein I3W98_41190, partial [Streptomyces cavourensis]|nr:hypothetical protein [Streptomyces cavourensis]
MERMERTGSGGQDAERRPGVDLGADAGFTRPETLGVALGLVLGKT